MPDATVVMTHRDPAKAIPSVCSLNATARRANDRVPDLARLGAEQLELWARGIERTMRARERAPERFVDVHFDELRARPHDVVRRLLAHAAASTPGAPYRVGDPDAALDAWLAANPSRPHRYDAGAFGLDAARIRERLADYVRRFDVALEGAD